MANEANKGSQKKSTSPYKAVKTYPTSPTSRYAPVVGFDPTKARGSMDRIERSSEINAMQEAGMPGFSMGASTPEQRQAYIDVYLNNNPDQTLGDGKVDFDITGGLGGLGGGSGKGGMSAGDRLDWAKWRYEKAQSEEEKRTKQKALSLLQGQLAGGYRGNIDDMLRRIKDMGTSAEGDISSAYTRALGNIGAGYGEAQRLMGTGYDALDAYLKQNNANPYAGLVAAAQGQIPDSMNYLQAYGAPTADVQGQIQAEQLAGQQGADAYNQLINVLTGAQNQSNLSRLAESQMARNLGVTGLGSQRAAFEAQAANAQAQALAALRERIAQQNLEQEALAGTRRQDIIDQLIAAGINPTA
jgi:hypothetical protein